MKETTTYHAVHDQNGNIESIFVTTSSIGAQQMMTPERGCSVSQVNLHELKLPEGFRISGEEDANRLLELRKSYRVDTSIVGSLVKKSATQK